MYRKSRKKVPCPLALALADFRVANIVATLKNVKTYNFAKFDYKKNQ